MLKNLFWLDGVCCADVGIRLQGPVTFGGASPNGEELQIPGRNGVLHIYDGSYSNVTGTARCFALARGSVAAALAAAARWALQEPGYHRLEVSEEPELFRLAAVTSGPETEIRMRTLAPFEIQFTCKPQRFLRSGARSILLPASGAVLHNPGMAALPAVTVTGGGTGWLDVGGTRVEFLESFAGPVLLDCDTQNACWQGANKNAEIRAPAFPQLPPGDCKITWGGGVQGVAVVPNWWTL